MSLINQVLRDLDARGLAAAVPGVQAPPRAQPGVAVPRGRPHPAWAALPVALLALLLSYFLGWWTPLASVPMPIASPPASTQAAGNGPEVASPDAAATAETPPSIAVTRGDEPAAPTMSAAEGDSSGPLANQDASAAPPPPLATPPSDTGTATASIPSAAAEAEAEAALAESASALAAVAPAAAPRLIEPSAPRLTAGPTRASTPEASAVPAPAPANESRLSIVPSSADGAGQLERQLHGAAAALRIGREDEAEAALLMALREQPGAHRARLALVALYQRQQRTELAIASLRQGLQLEPGAGVLADPLARLLLHRGEPAAAAASLAAALPRLASAPEQHALLAYAWAQAGQPQQAAAVYQQLVEHDPQRGAWWMGLGLAEAEQGHAPQALLAFRRARASHDLENTVHRFLDQRIHRLEAAAP